MAEQVTFAKKNRSQNFRTHASTKVTQSELAELERTAAERGLRLSEWIREVLFRELPDSHHPNFGDHINYGKRLLTEIGWSASFPDPRTLYVTRRMVGR
jgi:hypothetical protein